MVGFNAMVGLFVFGFLLTFLLVCTSLVETELSKPAAALGLICAVAVFASELLV